MLLDPEMTATPADIPVEWALFSHHARYDTIDRCLRWADDAWRARTHNGLSASPALGITVFTGHVLAFHPTGFALVSEDKSRTLRVIAVDALRVREKD